MFSYLLIWKINKKEKYNILQGIQYDSSLLLHWLVYIIPNPIKSLEINKIFVLTDAMYVAYPVFWFQLNMYICLLLQTSLTFSVYMDYMLFLWIFFRIWNKKDGLYGKEIKKVSGNSFKNLWMKFCVLFGVQYVYSLFEE